MLKSVLVICALVAGPAFADSPVISNVNISKSGGGWDFDVTLSHKDTGWDDYADAWRILDGDGNELGLRKLAHPHVGEESFTRSLSGIQIPIEVTEISVQARDTVGGWSSSVKKIKLR